MVPSCDCCMVTGSSRSRGNVASRSLRSACGSSVASDQAWTGATQSRRTSCSSRYPGSPRPAIQAARRARASAGARERIEGSAGADMFQRYTGACNRSTTVCILAAMTQTPAFLIMASLLAAPPLVAQAAAPLTQEQTHRAPGEDARLPRRASANSPGRSGIKRAGAMVFEQAYGMADRATKRPNTMTTEFNIGSINKVFTETAIRQLAVAGKLDLDSTLGHYWPDYPNAAARLATIRQLMTHEAGLGGNIFDPPPGGTRNDIKHNNEYLVLFASAPQAFAPGTSRRYCNACYVVLGMLIERLSGEDYYAYIRRHIYAPAGMTHSGSYKVDSLPPNTAIGYTTGQEDAPPGTPTAPEQCRTARTRECGGWRILDDRGPAAVRGGAPGAIGSPGTAGRHRHRGGSGGLNAVLEGDLPGGYDLAVAANLDPPAAERVAEMVRKWLGVTDGPGPGPGPGAPRPSTP